MIYVDLPRNTPKALWKYFYRQARIVNRESTKAAVDLMLYGKGVVKVSPEGAKHVPLKDLC